MAINSPTLEFSPAFSLFKRCVQCPNIAPSCPQCKSDEVCNQTLGDCNSCAAATCVKTNFSGAQGSSNISSSSGPNIGAIVGGVIGGVAVISIIVFCIWKFWLNGRRHDVEEDWDETDYPLEKPDNSVFQDRDASRASTHTVASMASTVLTRASNIIQIAYIPGVTNRTASSSPGLLVPPVPPIPIPTTPSSTNSQFDDQRFFVPGDLRGSTYSDMSSIDGGRRPGSIASSLARNSVATTVYRDSAVLHPMPAQAGFVSKAAVVSVKTGSAAPSPALTNASTMVPSTAGSSKDGNSPRPIMFKMPASSDNIKNAGGAVQTMKPVALTIVKKGAKTGNNGSSNLSISESSAESTPDRTNGESVGLGLRRPLTDASMVSGGTADSPGTRARRSVTLTLHTGDSDDSEDELEAHERSRRSLINRRESKVQSPFTDDAEAPKTPTTPSAPSHQPSPKAKSNEARGKSPFEDPA
jgi:hypothetical protein